MKKEKQRKCWVVHSLPRVWQVHYARQHQRLTDEHYFHLLLRKVKRMLWMIIEAAPK